MTYSNKEVEDLKASLAGRNFPIFVCSREMARGELRDFFYRNSTNITKIRNEEELKKGIEGIHKELKFSRHFEGLKESLLGITGMGVSVAGYGFSITKAGTNRQPSNNSQSSKQIVYIEQDSINPKEVNQLAAMYKDLPEQRRPMLFFEPFDNDTSYLRDLETLSSTIELKILGQVNKWFVNSDKKAKSKIESLDDFVNYFLSNSHNSCSNAESLFLSETDFARESPIDILRKLSLEALAIKSADYNGDKFKGKIKALQLIDKIQLATAYMKSRKLTECLFALKGIVSIWLAYIDENYRDGIDNCLAIARELDNQHLEAHCFRIMNIKTRGGGVTDHFLSKAVNYFFRTADHENYVYSKNNYLLNKLTFQGIEVEAFSELVDFCLEETKYIDRLSTIVNNAGTACLLSGKLSKAMEYYELAEGLSGQPIHRVGIEVNKLITRYMAGDIIDVSTVMRLFRRIDRENLPKGFDYHQSYIFWNLVKLADFNSDVKDEIFRYLKDKNFMDYSSVLRGEESMIDFLAKSQTLNRGKGRFSGPRGDFIHRSDLYPIVHYSWM